MDRNVSFWYLLPVSDETHPPRKASQENTGTRLQRWAVARCPVSAEACSAWGGPAPPNRPSLICRVSVSAAHLAEQQYLAGRGGLSCHCNKDSFVNIRLLGTEGFWEEKASPTAPPWLFPLRVAGAYCFCLSPPLGDCSCSPLISCLSLYPSTLRTFLSV